MLAKDKETSAHVEEKFGEQNFRVFSEMGGKNLYITLKIENLDRNGMEMQNSILPNFEISIFQKFGFEKLEIGISKPQF